MKKKFGALICLLFTFFSCENKAPEVYTSIVGSWRCEEFNPLLGSRVYLVEIDRKRGDTTQYLISNFYNLDINEFIFTRLIAKNLSIVQQQILAQTVKSGSGTVSDNFKRIDFNYNMYDGKNDIQVTAVYTRP